MWWFLMSVKFAAALPVDYIRFLQPNPLPRDSFVKLIRKHTLMAIYRAIIYWLMANEFDYFFLEFLLIVR
jgi:hypothetical protein